MKILAVENVRSLDPNIKKYTKLLLEKNIENDDVFESIFINITIQDDRPINFLYRLLWEHRYLRRKYTNYCSYKNEGNIYTLQLSVSEAKEFIRQVLPPAFKDRIHEAYNSLDILIETLRIFLLEGDKNDLSIFCKTVAWNPFETYMTYDKNRMKMLRKFHPTGLIVDIEAATCDFGKLYNDDVDETDEYVQVMFSCHTQNDLLQILIDVFNTNLELKLLTVYSDDDGYFIECSISNLLDMSDEFIELIQKTYKPLMG